MNKQLILHIREILNLRENFNRYSQINNDMEVMKIWARWIITHRSLFRQTSICLPSDSEYNPQLIVELMEKGISFEKAVSIRDWVIENVDRINSNSNSKFSLQSAEAEFGGIHGKVPIDMTIINRELTLSCDEINVTLPLFLYNKLLKSLKVTFKNLNVNNNGYIWYTCMLYSMLDGKGLQWAIPTGVMHVLQTRFKCSTELFASPLNRILDNYYSLFPFDRLFGSRGNFFEAPDSDFISGAYEVNPPFIDSLFLKTTHRILKLLSIADKNDKELSFIYIMPKWEDFETYSLVKESEYCIKEIILRPYCHYYFQYITNTYIKAKFTTCIVILSTNAALCDIAFENDIIKAFNKIYR